MGDRLPADLLAKTETTDKPANRKGISAAKRSRTGKKTATSRAKAPSSEDTTVTVAEPMARMTLVLRGDQLRWLQRKAFDAKMRGEKSDMSAIVRGLIDETMSN